MLVRNEVITRSSMEVTKFMKSKTYVLSMMLRKKRKSCSFQSNAKIYIEDITYKDYLLCESNTAPDLKGPQPDKKILFVGHPKKYCEFKTTKKKKSFSRIPVLKEKNPFRS